MSKTIYISDTKEVIRADIYGDNDTNIEYCEKYDFYKVVNHLSSFCFTVPTEYVYCLIVISRTIDNFEEYSVSSKAIYLFKDEDKRDFHYNIIHAMRTYIIEYIEVTDVQISNYVDNSIIYIKVDYEDVKRLFCKCSNEIAQKYIRRTTHIDLDTMEDNAVIYCPSLTYTIKNDKDKTFYIVSKCDRTSYYLHLTNTPPVDRMIEFCYEKQIIKITNMQ